MRILSLLLAAAACTPAPQLAPRPVPPLVSFLPTEVSPFILGRTATIAVTQAPPGERVFLAYSPNGIGNGPCPAAWGGACADLLPPISAIASEIANAAGEVQFDIALPTNLPFSEASLQVAVGGSPTYLSDPLSIELLEPDGDADADGVSNADELDNGTNPQLADSDGGGAEDGAEASCGSDPLDPGDDATCGNLDVTLDVTFTLDAVGASLCSLTTICDCVSTYVGSGTLIREVGGTKLFDGTWEVASTDCSPSTGFPGAVWTPASLQVFHTVQLDPSNNVVFWTAHEDPGEGVPQPFGTTMGGQFWWDGIQQPWTPGVPILDTDTQLSPPTSGVGYEVILELSLEF